MLENHKSVEELYLSSEFANEEKKAAANYVSWDLTPRQICDLELLLNGGFSPLKGAMPGLASCQRMSHAKWGSRLYAKMRCS